MKSELLKIELINIKAEDEARIKEMVYYAGNKPEDRDKDWNNYYENYGRPARQREKELENEIRKEQNREIAVGDGVTIHLYSDSNAATVIKRTKTTMTVQQDKATRDPNFKPEWVPGGFAAHCTNQNEQTYTYERNPEGAVTVFRWSEKWGRWQASSDGSIRLGIGRHEFYDYNF